MPATAIQDFAQALIAQPHGTRSDACKQVIRLALRSFVTVRSEQEAMEALREIVADVFGEQFERAA
jgi:hypothetical protein